jgi:hypothetical protein
MLTVAVEASHVRSQQEAEPPFFSFSGAVGAIGVHQMDMKLPHQLSPSCRASSPEKGAQITAALFVGTSRLS